MNYPNPPPQKNTISPLKVVGTLVGLVLIAFVIVAGVQGCQDSNAPTSTTPGQVTQVVPQTVATTETVVYHVPAPADFTLQVLTLSQQCFGSAGCNVTYRIQPQCNVCSADDSSKQYIVTYQLSGATDGQQVGNFTLTGSTASDDSQDFTQTPSSKTQLTATVTQVLPA